MGLRDFWHESTQEASSCRWWWSFGSCWVGFTWIWSTAITLHRYFRFGFIGIIIVDGGHRGIMFSRIGGVKPDIYAEGLHFRFVSLTQSWWILACLGFNILLSTIFVLNQEKSLRLQGAKVFPALNAILMPLIRSRIVFARILSTSELFECFTWRL